MCYGDTLFRCSASLNSIIRLLSSVAVDPVAESFISVAVIGHRGRRPRRELSPGSSDKRYGFHSSRCEHSDILIGDERLAVLASGM